MATRDYLLTDTQDNPPTVQVDDKTLQRGGEPASLSDDQAQRVRDLGVQIDTVKKES